MATLKEIRGRIASVKTTLKTTSAMKMVSSAKLHKVQGGIAAMLPYQQGLHDILSKLLSDKRVLSHAMRGRGGEPSGRYAVVVISSDASLCGAFNANVIKAFLDRWHRWKSRGLDAKRFEIYPIGRKICEALVKEGIECSREWSYLSAKPEFSVAAELASMLSSKYERGELDKVIIIYNHFHSVGRQHTLVETFLPLSRLKADFSFADSSEYILEPDALSLYDSLLPEVLNLKMYSVLMDASAAEHAARMVAMQTATDNGEELLGELTLEFNKRRQQAITAELLDLSGAFAE